MEHLFEPFFTTRSDHSGTGLGLAVVHGIMAEFGGGIDVHNLKPHGQPLHFIFPKSNDTVGLTDAPKIAEKGNGQTIMVVDDEPVLVELIAGTLQGLGYEAIGYDQPLTALAALEKEPTKLVCGNHH